MVAGATRQFCAYGLVDQCANPGTGARGLFIFGVLSFSLLSLKSNQALERSDLLAGKLAELARLQFAQG